MPNKLKELLLGRGWAGRTISRADTVERLNPILRDHIELNHCYEYVIRHHGDQNVADALRQLQRTARADVGKLSETILSCGGVAYNGTDLEPEDFNLGEDPTEMLFQVLDREDAFRETVREERNEIEHQMRTRAILEVVAGNSDERLSVMRRLTKGLSRSTPA